MNIEVLKTMLESENVACDIAMSGKQALELFEGRLTEERCSYKLILLDYSMPEMDGPEVARLMRQVCDNLSCSQCMPYIVCCSAYGGENSFKRQALEAGMNEFKRKPLSHDDVLRILAHTKSR